MSVLHGFRYGSGVGERVAYLGRSNSTRDIGYWDEPRSIGVGDFGVLHVESDDG